MHFGVLALFPRCQCGPGSKSGALAQDRPFAHDEPHVAVFGQQRVDFGHGAFAVGTVVVEKFHHRHIAIRVAQHRRVGVAIKQRTLAGQYCGRGSGLGIGLSRFQRLKRLEHKLRVLAHGLGDQRLDAVVGKILRQGQARQDESQCCGKQD